MQLFETGYGDIIVDDEDHDRLWNVKVGSNGDILLVRTQGHFVALGKWILGLQVNDRKKVRHLNGNKKDFRKENLEVYGFFPNLNKRRKDWRELYCGHCLEKKSAHLFLKAEIDEAKNGNTAECKKCTSERCGHEFGHVIAAKQNFIKINKAAEKREFTQSSYRKAVRDQEIQRLLEARKRRLAK